MIQLKSVRVLGKAGIFAVLAASTLTAGLLSGFGSAQAGLVLTNPPASPAPEKAADAPVAESVAPAVTGINPPAQAAAPAIPTTPATSTNPMMPALPSVTTPVPKVASAAQNGQPAIPVTTSPQGGVVVPTKTSPAIPTQSKPMQTEVIEGGAMQGSEGKSEKTYGPAQPSSTDHGSSGTEQNLAFAYTHMLPSPLGLTQGAVRVGTDVAYGVTDYFQIGTNVIRDVNQIWNAQAQFPIISYPTFVATVTMGFQNYDLQEFDERNPDLRITSWQPGIVTGYEIDSRTALFVGGQFSTTSKDLPDNYFKSGYVRGAYVETDISWMYNPPESSLSKNALSAGISYDATYEHLGAGFSHHWPGFDVGFHYYFGVDHARFMPIANLTSGWAF